MGEHVENAEFRAHGQPQGEESQHLRLHHGDLGVDEVHDLDEGDWVLMRLHAQTGYRQGFEVLLLAAVTPTGGWSQGWKDAAWRAACRMWGP